MFANDFEYYRAGTADEAVELLAEHDGAELVAGAHGLLPRMRTGEEAPPALVDISGAHGLSSIDETDAELSIGALVTHAELATTESVRRRAPALADAAGEVGDLQVRNGGTIGGNLAHGDGRADLPAAILALEGLLAVQGPDGERTIDAGNCFLNHFETAVADDEIVTAVRIPATDDDTGDVMSAYRKRRNPRSGYALVGVAVWLQTDVDNESIQAARVAVTGATTRSRRLHGVENALEGASITSDMIAEAADRAGERLDEDAFRSGPQASASYRRHLVSVDTERVLRDALGLDTN